MRMLFVSSVVFFAILFNGCASITKGTSDVVNVEVSNCGEKIDCTASNKKGTWNFRAPGPVKFKKSDDPLHIQCEDGPDEVAERTLTPTRDAMIWGNILVGGIIGGGVDAYSDGHWDLPDSTTLVRQTCRGKPVDG